MFEHVGVGLMKNEEVNISQGDAGTLAELFHACWNRLQGEVENSGAVHAQVLRPRLVAGFGGGGRLSLAACEHDEVLGASAIGGLPQGFVQNATQERDWREAVRAGRLPVARGLAFTAEDRWRAEIIERLMCRFEVDLESVCARHGRRLSDLTDDIDRLDTFLADGLAVIDGGRVSVTPAGRLLVRSIAAAFDGYFNPAGERHARAI